MVREEFGNGSIEFSKNEFEGIRRTSFRNNATEREEDEKSVSTEQQESDDLSYSETSMCFQSKDERECCASDGIDFVLDIC